MISSALNGYPKAGIVAVAVDGGVYQVGFFPVAGGDGVGVPMGVGLPGEAALIGASLAASSRTSGYIIFLD